MIRLKHVRRMFSILFFVALHMGLAGCASVSTVQAWQKGYLARPDMSLDGNALEAKFVDHIYFSKEAASGGAGVAGGGCGCN